MDVYLISSNSLLLENVDAFLKKKRVSWSRRGKRKPAELLVELAGRICYMSFGDRQRTKTNRDFIHNLIRSGHDSVLEHVTWSFLAVNVSRSLTHQLVRHRVGFSFSELSQQYFENMDLAFVEPRLLKKSPKNHDLVVDTFKSSKHVYQALLASLKESGDTNDKLSHKEKMRAIRSAARSILPNATSTVIFFTANARALRHFLKVRGTIPGDEEMRRLASKLLRILKKDAPNLFYDFRVEKMDDGSPIITWEKHG